MDTLYIEKFLSQVHRKLKEQGISNSKLREDCIEVFEGENVIFKIDAKGGMFYSSDKQFRNIVDKLHDKIQPIVCEVDEYLRAMDNGTELKARDFDMPYIKIAEYNEVVLAGTEHKNGSFEFATWSYKNNSLYHGNYTTDYKGAREDFATRSGLVNKNLLFNKNELVEIYRCIEDTLNNEFEITDKQKEMLEDLQTRISSTVAKHLGITVSEFYEKYTRMFLLEDVEFPIFTLKVTGKDNACIFLNGKRCSVQDAKPRTCKMYPFWVCPDDKGGFQYNFCTEKRHHPRTSKACRTSCNGCKCT